MFPPAFATQSSPIGTNKVDSSDFVGGFATNQLVNFPAGVASRTITINVIADSTVEPTETFRVTLNSATGATIGTAFANGAIRNDDTTTGAVPEGDLIAVADPLWMFIPPEYLTDQELAVPVMSWVNGVPVVGDAAHDHEHSNETDLVQEILMSPVVYSTLDSLSSNSNSSKNAASNLELSSTTNNSPKANSIPLASQMMQTGIGNSTAIKQPAALRPKANHLAVDIAIGQEFENWDKPLSAGLDS